MKKWKSLGPWSLLALWPSQVWAVDWAKAMTHYRNTRSVSSEFKGFLIYGGGIVGGLLVLWLLMHLYHRLRR